MISFFGDSQSAEKWQQACAKPDFFNGNYQLNKALQAINPKARIVQPGPPGKTITRDRRPLLRTGDAIQITTITILTIINQEKHSAKGQHLSQILELFFSLLFKRQALMYKPEL
ncbi:MAG: hypothetical protein JZU50_12825 [Desulfobulbaceae bacterium]|nr:hypothetical protein [Desulfobulbaceae bacterium]